VALLSDIIDDEPTYYEEAAEKKEWKDGMIKEYQSIVKNDVWDVVVPRPKEKTVVSSKWIYKTKHSTDGSVEKYKARFVGHGFSQKEGIDYETFASVARYTSIRSILVIAAVMKWKVHRMDVKTTFLNGVIEEEVYVEQPQGFEINDNQTHV
jgi:hypothetical protein